MANELVRDLLLVRLALVPDLNGRFAVNADRAQVKFPSLPFEYVSHEVGDLICRRLDRHHQFDVDQGVLLWRCLNIQQFCTDIVVPFLLGLISELLGHSV